MSSPLSSAIRTSSTLRSRSSIWMMACTLNRSFAIALRVEDQVGDELGGFVVKGRDDVAVDAEGDGDGGVAESFLDHPRVDPTFERQRRPGVPQSLERQPRQAGGTHPAHERRADRIRLQTRAIRMVEDKASVLERRAD